MRLPPVRRWYWKPPRHLKPENPSTTKVAVLKTENLYYGYSSELGKNTYYNVLHFSGFKGRFLLTTGALPW